MKVTSRSIIYDRWLSEAIGRDAVRLVVSDELIREVSNKKGTEYDMLQDVLSRPVFLYAKVSVLAIGAIKFLEKLGFHLIDTNILFSKPIGGAQSYAGECEVRCSIPQDQKEVVELASKSFIYSRFCLDNVFSADVVKIIKSQWASNFFAGKRGDKMIVALADEAVVGFLQLLYRKESLTIDLITVNEKYRRRGIARDMITFAETECLRCDHINVGTQVANIPSMRLYETMGFRVSDAYYLFHYHNIEPGKT
jgi:ribosomal protein S18 acetylase RimI-like enzyme